MWLTAGNARYSDFQPKKQTCSVSSPISMLHWDAVLYMWAVWGFTSDMMGASVSTRLPTSALWSFRSAKLQMDTREVCFWRAHSVKEGWWWTPISVSSLDLLSDCRHMVNSWFLPWQRDSSETLQSSVRGSKETGMGCEWSLGVSCVLWLAYWRISFSKDVNFFRVVTPPC